MTAFRDREFDSQLREDVERTHTFGERTFSVNAAGDANETTRGQSCYVLERACIPHCAAPPSPTDAEYEAFARKASINEAIDEAIARRTDLTPQVFGYATREIKEANDEIFGALTTGDWSKAREANQRALSALLAPYYLGRGKLDDTRLLADLTRSKGEPLTPAEIGLYARVAGIWAGERLASEVNDEIIAAYLNGAADAAIVGIIRRGMEDATSGRSA